jgi:hypothetical protein
LFNCALTELILPYPEKERVPEGESREREERLVEEEDRKFLLLCFLRLSLCFTFDGKDRNLELEGVSDREAEEAEALESQ